MNHPCHAAGCTTPVRPEMLMCVRHWRMVPKTMQRAVWTHYREGQCDDKRPSAAWHVAASRAIAAVAELEGRAADAAKWQRDAAQWEARLGGRLERTKVANEAAVQLAFKGLR